MNIQWYPGHMTKAKRAMKEDIKLIDLVIELVDARVPFSSRNPDIDELAAGKARMVLLNKADLADERKNEQWTSWFKAQGFHVVKINARTGMGLKQITPLVQEACREKIERDRRRGIKNRPVRAMVVGVPNVGKSTFINKVARKKSAKAGDRPGVTRGKQWVNVDSALDLLDTPGILWPKFEDPHTGMVLAFTGAVKDEIMDVETLGCHLMAYLGEHYPQVLTQSYKLPEVPARQEEENDIAYGYRLLEAGAAKRGMRISGGELDTERMARVLLDEYRAGKLGRFTLETPEGTSI